ncbi:MAG: hypothetical protein ACIAQF_10315 [Phycisphaerales bacterium JB065]
MSSELIKTVRDWGIIGGALLVVGPIAGSIAGSLQTESGLDQASPLTSSSPVSGVLVGMIVIAIAIGYGVIAGRIAHARLGIVGAGLVLTWPAWQFGRVADLVRDAGGLAPIRGFMLEGVIFGVACFAGVAFVLRFSRPVMPTESPESGSAKDMVFATGASVIGAALGAWLIAQSSLQGQVYAAAVAAGIVGGAAGRSVANRAPMLPILAGGLLLAVIGPLTARFGVSVDPLGRLYAGDWPGLALLTPFDWFAGILVGAPLGEMWANSMIDRQSVQNPKPRTA